VPFLRVLRDKRGYETTYLVHWFRDGGRQRSKILYVFRTPPGVRVGRDVLDPDVLREIEAQHPDIEFDWRALVDNRQIIDNTPEQRRTHGARNAARPERPEIRKRRKEKDEDTPPAPVAPIPEAAAAPAPAPARPAVPGAIEGDTREAQLAFLARWYPELRDRIPHRTQDPLRRETLLALVERLNAAAWETEEQMVAGLQTAAEALYRLSRIFSKRRRRPRRPRPSESEAPPTNEPG
jgi:hypothetical protein